MLLSPDLSGEKLRASVVEPDLGGEKLRASVVEPDSLNLDLDPGVFSSSSHEFGSSPRLSMTKK